MARLVYIKEIKSSKLLCLGINEAGECKRYTVTHRDYAELGSPLRESELSDSQTSAIRYSDTYVKAKKKALSYLSFADNSEKNLKIKLLRYGIPAEIAEEVSREMVSLGYIDESRQLERLVAYEANSALRGPNKIIPKLVSRGYSASEIRRVMRELSESGEIDFSRSARELIKKKLPDDATADERRTLLMKNGYKVSMDNL